MDEPEKILAIQFKSLGDAALMVPALRALRRRWPDSRLHVALAEEILPLLERIPWLDKLWPFPRTRGRARMRESYPIVRALRRERYTRSVDFGGNDRGALLSRLVGAPERLGRALAKATLLSRICYTTRAMPDPTVEYQAARLASLLSVWGVPPPDNLNLEVRADPGLSEFARRLAPGRPVICHVVAGRPKKEWRPSYWAELHRRAAAAGMETLFTSGPAERERQLLEKVRSLAPDMKTAPALPNLLEFLAVLNRARVFVSADTGPLHFAAGLGVPTLSLFGPTSLPLWKPRGDHHLVLCAACVCPKSAKTCIRPPGCMAAITPAAVFRVLQDCAQHATPSHLNTTQFQE